MYIINWWVEGYSAGTGSQSKETSYFQLYAYSNGETAGARTYVTNNAINLTDISTIYMEIEAPSGQGGTSSQFQMRIGTAKLDTSASAWVEKKIPPYAKQTISLDVTSLTGNYYLKLYANASGTSGNNITVKITKVWR